MSRHWAPGARKPIEGAPFARWTIVQRPGPVAWPLKHTEYPDGPVDAGEAVEFLGDVVLVPTEGRIHVRPVRGATFADCYDLIQWAQKKRDSGDFGLSVTPEQIAKLTTVIEIEKLHRTYPVVRCDVLGCEKFYGWHRANDPAPHVAHDLSKAGRYTCRLLFVYGEWVPEVRTAHGLGGVSTAAVAAGLASDIQWILAEAKTLNNAREAVSA